MNLLIIEKKMYNEYYTCRSDKFIWRKQSANISAAVFSLYFASRKNQYFRLTNFTFDS